MWQEDALPSADFYLVSGDKVAVKLVSTPLEWQFWLVIVKGKLGRIYNNSI